VKSKSKIASGIIFIILAIFCYTNSFAYCVYNETKYIEQAQTCQSGRQYQCEDGTWTDVNADCQDAQTMQSYDNSACACTNEEEHNCNSSEQHCSSSKESGRCISKCVD
jgi:hypothetical protein